MQPAAPVLQMLAAAGHKRAALPRRQVGVAGELLGQLPFTGAGAEAALRRGQVAGHEGTEALAATEQIDAVALNLQLQSLLQGAEPGLNGR